ncbi:MAG: methyltransferase domain-containing protein [Actinomycetota bacterium]|nr:methyltransferase domain-containing protein [Actinomycetota bacterium]
MPRFVGGVHSRRPDAAAPPQTRGYVLTSGWRYDLMLWCGNLVLRGQWQGLRQRTLDLAQLQRGETVLDVGCGTGTLALLVPPRVGDTGQVYGIDPSGPMIARARRKAARRRLAIDFQVGVIEQLPFADQSCEVVLSTFMMHQLPDDLKVHGLAEIARVLKPGGRLLVIDTRRPPEHPGGPARLVHTGRWNSGIQDQPALLQQAGFVQITSGALETRDRWLPEIGFVRGETGRASGRSAASPPLGTPPE